MLGYLTEVRKNDKGYARGNGVIPLLLAAKSTQPIEGIEIQEQLVSMARRSFKLNDLNDRLTISYI